jgi:inosine-uridine nucleoside N-ribohydrolase
LAVRHPAIELEAVVSVAGNVALELTTRNTLRVLDWLNASDVPVFAGADRPLRGELREASHWHGADGLGGAQLPDAQGSASGDGIAFLCECLLRNYREISLVCTAPLTNIALALQREPRIVSAVRSIVLMGGAARVSGNVTPLAEFNIYADPDAGALVFQQTWPIVMVGLDVTERVRLSREERDSLVTRESPEAVLLREVTRHLFDVREVDSMALHDPLALLVAADPTLVTSVHKDVFVETRGEHTLGQTVVDWRRAAPPPSLNTRICTEVDAARAKDLFLATLLG